MSELLRYNHLCGMPVIAKKEMNMVSIKAKCQLASLRTSDGAPGDGKLWNHDSGSLQLGDDELDAASG
jgi:hypothetical protein